MTFDVRINVSGLCLWTVEEGRAVHVLMPASGSHGGAHAAPRHFVRVMYDAAYETPGSAAFARVRRCVALDGEYLTFPRALSPDVATALPPELLDLCAAVGAPPIRREFVAGRPSDPVTSRLTFECGRFSECILGHRVSLGAVQNLDITTNVEWTIRGVPGDALEGLDTSGRALPPLYPIGGLVHLYLFHAPADELAAIDIGRGYIVADPREHFELYFRLFPGFDAKEKLRMIRGVGASRGRCEFPDGELASDTSMPVERDGRFMLDTTSGQVARPQPPRVLTTASLWLGATCGGSTARLA
jgi:hypothetical protein